MAVSQSGELLYSVALKILGLFDLCAGNLRPLLQGRTGEALCLAALILSPCAGVFVFVLLSKFALNDVVCIAGNGDTDKWDILKNRASSLFRLRFQFYGVLVNSNENVRFEMRIAHLIAFRVDKRKAPKGLPILSVKRLLWRTIRNRR